MKIKQIYSIALLLLSSIACKEEQLQPYQGESYVFFAPGADKKAPQIDFSFAYFPKTSDTTIAIQMTLWGNLFPADYTYTIKGNPIGNNPAQEQVDYSYNATNSFRKNRALDSCYIRLLKTTDLLKEAKTFEVALVDARQSTGGLYHKVQFRISDEVAKPAWWTTASKFSSLGAYSDIKLRQLIIFKGKNVNLEADSSFAISTLAKEFKAYLISQWNQGNRIYAEDGKKPLHETLGV